MKKAIKTLWEEKPLVLILYAGILFRLLAVIFSKGYGMHDDHFLIIESSQSWVDGYDYNHWLPFSGAKVPDGDSLFYPGLHFLLFLYFKWRGLLSPQGKMYFVRALNALWSLLTITYGYKIAEHYGGRKVAKQAGLMLAILWFMPMLCVRDLVEMFCIPAMMVATWLLIAPERQNKMKTFLWAGIFGGIAFNVRFESMLFVGVLGLVLLFQKKWKPFCMYALGMCISIFAVQGIVDICIWKRPFAEFFQYVNINLHNYNDFIKGPWYNYLLLIGGILIPPIGVFILFGYFRSWKKYALLFWPSFIFLAFHSSFPNKQERFILPIVPFVLILGLIGWTEFSGKSAFWQKHSKLLHRSWIFFWVLNCIALPVVSTMYSKKSRVEAMTFLGHQKNLHGIMMEQSYAADYIMPPLYYVGSWKHNVVGVTRTHSLLQTYLDYHGDPRAWVHPNYVLFVGNKNIKQRVAAFQEMFPTSDQVVIMYPSFMDDLLEWLNPVNQNQIIYIYYFSEKDMHLPNGVIAPSAYNPSLSSGS